MAFLGTCAVLRTRLSHACAFSTSKPVLASFKNIFGRNKAPEDTGEQEVEQSDRQLARNDIQRSGLGAYEKAALQSLADKGMGKTELPYNPPQDVGERMQAIYREVFGDENVAEPLTSPFPDRARKFQFLTACEKAFSHSVSNSRLYEMKTVGNVLEFYLESVQGTNGLTQFGLMNDLPENLHINFQPHRFDPDNDPYYGGISAFPHSSSIITSLKYKKIYKSRKAELKWPKVLDCAPLNRNRGPSSFIKRS